MCVCMSEGGKKKKPDKERKEEVEGNVLKSKWSRLGVFMSVAFLSLPSQLDLRPTAWC